MDAAEIGSVKVINVLVKNSSKVNEEDKEHHAAISYCLDFISKDEQKFFDSALALINHGANPNYAGKFTNRTLLHYAAAAGNLDLVKQLIEENQAYANPIDDDGKTPVDYAIENDKEEVRAYLEQAMPNSSGCSCTIL